MAGLISVSVNYSVPFSSVARATAIKYQGHGSNFHLSDRFSLSVYGAAFYYLTDHSSGTFRTNESLTHLTIRPLASKKAL